MWQKAVWSSLWSGCLSYSSLIVTPTFSKCSIWTYIITTVIMTFEFGGTPVTKWVNDAFQCNLSQWNLSCQDISIVGFLRQVRSHKKWIENNIKLHDYIFASSDKAEDKRGHNERSRPNLSKCIYLEPDNKPVISSCIKHDCLCTSGILISRHSQKMWWNVWHGHYKSLLQMINERYTTTCKLQQCFVAKAV